jgi:hypothetical protein
MKNQLRYIKFLTAIILVFSCTDEDKYPIPDFTKTSIPVFLVGQDDTGFIDFMDLQRSTLSFKLDKRGSEDVQSIDVLITYNNSETGESETVQYTTVATLPQQVNLTFAELIDLFPDEVVTEDTLSLGDSFVVAGNVLLQDGRYLEGGYSPSVAANDPVFLTYNVACASDLAGTYDLTLISGTNGEASSLPGQTITEISPGFYELSDATMDIFGPDFPIKYRFTDICGNLIAEDESVDFGSQIVMKFNPDTAIDPATGVITFSVEYISPSCCGLAGIKTVFKATPK